MSICSVAISALRPVLVVLGAAWAAAAAAETREIFPGDSFEAAAESLNPGDTLIVHEGTYSDTGRVAITVRGTAELPVVITGAPGENRPLISRTSSAPLENTIDIVGATYLTIRGLEITSNGGDGVNMSGGPSYITLEDLEIHDIAVGINYRSSMHNIIARRNHIYRTQYTGEGFYVGCNYAECVVRDSIIENNWIHDTQNTEQGDGIEIKRGSHSNIIRDNVIHDTFYPCILLYGTEGQPANLVEGNVMWNCADSGIQAAADSIIRNNIILASSGGGFNSQSHQGVSPRNLQFVHNTIIGGDPCVRLNGWSGAPGLVFANNAVYCATDDFVIGGLSGVTVSGNVIVPSTSAFPAAGYTVGRSAQQDMVDANGRDVYPTADSALLDAGSASWSTAVDFNGTARSGSLDAGAYTWTTAGNPGWPVAPGFKGGAAGAPTLNLSADPESVGPQGSSELSWSSTGAQSCTASGAWTGPRATQGRETVGPVATTSTFTLRCESSGGQSVSRSVTITVANGVPVPTVQLDADPDSVPPDGSTTLAWSSSNAAGCQASGDWGGIKPTSGSESIGPLSRTSSFALECSGAGGSASDEVEVSVVVPGAPVISLDADPDSVAVNGSSLLTWNATNATSCTAGGGWSGTKALSGSESVGPLASTTPFSLSCTGSGGQSQRTVTVTVSGGGGTGGGSGADGGGGAGDAVLLLLLLGAAAGGRSRGSSSCRPQV